jgi:hypothetical protein
MLDPKIKTKIIRKIMGIGIYRTVSGDKPRLKPSEFRFILSYWQIKYKDWWDVLKELETDGIVRMPKNNKFIIILMDGAMVQKYVIQKEG